MSVEKRDPMWWGGWGSNPRPKDYESVPLGPASSSGALGTPEGWVNPPPASGAIGPDPCGWRSSGVATSRRLTRSFKATIARALFAPVGFAGHATAEAWPACRSTLPVVGHALTPFGAKHRETP